MYLQLCRAGSTGRLCSGFGGDNACWGKGTVPQLCHIIGRLSCVVWLDVVCKGRGQDLCFRCASPRCHPVHWRSWVWQAAAGPGMFFAVIVCSACWWLPWTRLFSCEVVWTFGTQSLASAGPSHINNVQCCADVHSRVPLYSGPGLPSLPDLPQVCCSRQTLSSPLLQPAIC